jgi:hypothetical protein
MNKPRHLRLVKVDPEKEQRIADTLYRQLARREVEIELRRKGIKPAYVSLAELTMLVRIWIHDHPRPTKT